MKRFVTTILAAVAVAACFDDPTSDLRGGPAAIRLNASTLFLEPAESVGVVANLVDAQGNQVPGAVTFTSVDPAVATAGDVGSTIPGDVEHSGWVKSVAAAGGATYVRATGGGITDSIYVIVVPSTFSGTVTAGAALGDPSTIAATSVITFDPASAEVFVDDVPTFVTAATTSQITFIAPATTAGVVSVGGLKLVGSIDLPALVSGTPITVADASEPGNNASGTAVAVTPPAAVGDSVIVYGSVDGADPSDYYTFTMPVTAVVSVRLEFFGDGSGSDDLNPDFDLVVCDSLSGTGGCSYAQDDIPGNGASSLSNPEEGSTPSMASGKVIFMRVLPYFATGDAKGMVYRIIVRFD